MNHSSQSRRRFLRNSSVATLGSLLFSRASMAASQKPNILVFMADDAGMDFGCYGNKGIKTPNIDKLAKSGLKFENAFLTAPQCSPSRTSILSGQFAHTIGTEDLHVPIDDKTTLLPTYLKKANYFTGIMLKTHVGNLGVKQFDWYDNGHKIYGSGEWNKNPNKYFSEFLDKAGDKPFFMWVGFIDPHRSYAQGKTAAPKVNDPAKTAVPSIFIDSDKTRRDLADYYDEITRMDIHIGQMLDAIDKRGLRENTVIIFLSDNGMPFPRCKGTLYDKGIQTPLIFSWKNKIKPNRTFDGLTSVIDLAPTFLDLAGLQKPSEMYGKSIKNILSNPTDSGDEYVFSERNWHNCDEHMRSVRSEKYKLIINAYIELPHGTASDLASSPTWYELKRVQREGKLTKAQERLFECPRAAVEFYDLENDPDELINIADRPEHAAKIKEMAQVLYNWQKETNDHPSWQRRRNDNTCRITGVKFNYDNPGFWD